MLSVFNAPEKKLFSKTNAEGDENLKAKEGNVLAKNKIFYGFSFLYFIFLLTDCCCESSSPLILFAQ